MTEGNTSTKAAIEQASRLMKNGCECFDKLSMHGISSGNSSSGPLVLSLSKDSERVFHQPARVEIKVKGQLNHIRSSSHRWTILSQRGMQADLCADRVSGDAAEPT
jgi:hypothetical protein